MTPEEVEHAFINRQAIAIGSASGPSVLGQALSVIGKGDSDSGWAREGENSICKRATTAAEADFYRAVIAAGDLAPHIPVIYSIDKVDGDGEVYDIRMQVWRWRIECVAPGGTRCADEVAQSVPMRSPLRAWPCPRRISQPS